MLIAQILAGKGSDVVSTRPEATVAEVARLLKEKHIGAVVVLDRGGRLCGIISERDLARGLADHGGGLLEMKVAQLMTRGVVTCAPEDDVTSLIRDGHRRQLASPSRHGVAAALARLNLVWLLPRLRTHT